MTYPSRGEKRRSYRVKKSYGQHFLVSEDIAERIAGSLSRAEDYDRILEVGPGKGMLTKYLIDGDKEFSAVEADEDMVSFLLKTYPQLEGNLFHFNFLRFDPSKEFGDQEFALIGNYPYNISSQIVFRMLKYKRMIPVMVGMFQKEMALRIAASPGSKDYGIISVLTQAYYRCEFLFKVEKGNFQPPPKVKSGVIRCSRIDGAHPNLDYSLFKSIVKITFNNRRKMLRNTMKHFLEGSSILKNPYFDQRPEQLSVEEFVKLTELVKIHRENN